MLRNPLCHSISSRTRPCNPSTTHSFPKFYPLVADSQDFNFESPTESQTEPTYIIAAHSPYNLCPLPLRTYNYSDTNTCLTLNLHFTL